MIRKAKRIIISILLLASISLCFGSNDVFADNPSIAISPTVGGGGTIVTVVGTGFNPGETGITILFDDFPVNLHITADSAGHWIQTFTVPALTFRGTHKVSAFGSITPATSVSVVPFETIGLSPPIIISPANGSTITNLTPAFSWPPLSGVTRYEFQLSTTPTFSTTVFTDQPTAASTKIPDTSPLTFNKQYFWRVRSIEPIQGDWSAIANFFAVVMMTASVSPPTTTTPSVTTIVVTPTYKLTTPPINEKIAPIYILVIIIVALLLYCYLALCLQIIAKKTNTTPGWLAWIPILNIYLMCSIAGKPGWWLVFFFIPVLNLVFTIIVWMDIAKACRKNGWLGVLIIIPVANVILPGYLALSK